MSEIYGKLGLDVLTQNATLASSRFRFARRFPAGTWTVYGFTALWCAGILVPLASVIALSFFQTSGLTVIFEPTLRAYERLFSSAGGTVIVQTMRIAGTVTALELAIAFPFALWMAKGVRSTRLRLITLTLLTVPFFLSPAARTMVWRSVLGLDGLINNFLIGLGFIDQPIEWLLFSEFAIHLGLVGPYFPNMFFPIFLSISLIDDEYLEASKDLGASGRETLLRVIVPLSLPGVVAGIVFTFIPMLGDTVIPQLLGGNQVLMMSATVASLIGAMNYTVAAALAAVVVIIMLALQGLLGLALRSAGGVNEVFSSLKR